MARDAMAMLVGQRILFHAVFRRFSLSTADPRRLAKTVLLGPVFTEGGEFLADHLWVRNPKPFAEIDLMPGMAVEVRGTVEAYTRKDGGVDYRLARPREVRTLPAQVPPADPLSGLGDRLAACLGVVQRTDEDLAHLRRILFSTGGIRGQRGDPYGVLLQARGQLWAVGKALQEARGLYGQIREAAIAQAQRDAQQQEAQP